MFFTTIGVGIAWIMFLFGTLRIAMGIGLAFGDAAPAIIGEYLGRTTTGEAIDQGLYWAFVGVLIGILTESSKSLAKLR